MDSQEELRRSLTDFVKGNNKVEVEVAQVKSVDEDKMICDLIDLDDNELLDVRLSADDSTKGLVLIPKVGSWVVVTNLNDSDELCILRFTEVDKIIMLEGNMSIELDKNQCLIKNQTTELLVNKTGIKIASGSESLKGLIGELIAAIKLITVTSTAPGTPTSTPLNFAVFDVLKTRFNSLLK